MIYPVIQSGVPFLSTNNFIPVPRCIVVQIMLPELNNKLYQPTFTFKE